MKSWKKAHWRPEEQMIRQSAERCCQIAQYQKLARSSKKDVMGERKQKRPLPRNEPNVHWKEKKN
jgi:hypothetical protein